VTTRLTANDVLLASDHPQQSIVRISRGDGYAQYGGMPVIVESNYHISEQEYQRRKAMPWPAGMPGAFVPGTVSMAPAGRGGSPTVGPVVTTEVIGGSSSASDLTAADASFAPFVEMAKPAKPRRNTRRKQS
jgi:hypothetical protein